MSEEEKKVIEYLKNYCNTDLLYEQKHYDYINFLIKSFEKQQKLINIFIHNEAVREGKDFNEIKDKYYEFL